MDSQIPISCCQSPVLTSWLHQWLSGRSDVHCLWPRTIVWKNLPPLCSLFLCCTETLPELDSLLPTDACWWNQNGLTLHHTDFCFGIVSNYCSTLVWVWKTWWVRHLQTVRSFVSQQGNSICEGPKNESQFWKHCWAFICCVTVNNLKWRLSLK